MIALGALGQSGCARAVITADGMKPSQRKDSMRIGELRDFLVKSLPKKKQTLVEGPPGVGKTYACQEACDQLDWDVIGISMPVEDPSTIRGYPSRGADGRAHHCLFDGIAAAMDAQRPTLLLLDDIGMASEATLKAVLRFVQFREIDGRRLPNHVVICAATNDVGHGAGVFGLIEPLKSRWDTIVKVETNLDDVVGYGLARNWPSDLCAFLRNAPDALHDWKPSKSMHIDGACPRGWEHVAEWINDGFDDPEVIAGCVGKGRATQYLAFRALMNELPDVDGVLMDPDNAPVPENPSARFLVAMALASRMSHQNFGSCVKYLMRLPAMFRAFSLRDAFRAEAEKTKAKKQKPDFRPISTSRDFSAWACGQDGKEIMSAVG